MADMIAEVVVSSIFEKKMSKLKLEEKILEEKIPVKQKSALHPREKPTTLSDIVIEEGENENDADRTSDSTIRSMPEKTGSSTLLWSSSYGPKPSFHDGTSESNEGDSPVDNNVVWWQKHGTTVLFLGLLPLSVLSLLLLAIPFGESEDPKTMNHITWLFLYDFCLPVGYSAYINYVIIHHTHISHSGFVYVFPLLSGSLTFCMVCLSGYYYGFPVKYSLCYFFGSVCLVTGVLYGAMAMRARTQRKEKKLFRIIVAICTIVSLGLGWTFATIVLKLFNGSSVFLQSVIVSALSIWKFICMQGIKIASKMVDYSGQKYELLFVALSSIFVHWFWTIFTDIAFASVESVWTFIIYLVVDMGTGLLFILQTSETFLTADFRNWEPYVENDSGPFQGWIFRKVLKKKPTIKKVKDLTEDEKLVYHLDTLFNSVCFFFVQMGECMYAIYTTILFLVCRFGPNSQNSALSTERISDKGFEAILTYLLIIVLSEVLVTVRS